LPQPAQHRLGCDREDPRRGADPQALSEAGQEAQDEFDCGLSAGEDRAMPPHKIPLTRSTVEPPPGATTGMTMGPEIATPQPASVVTTGLRTNMPAGVDLTRTPVRRGPGVRWHRQRSLGRRVLSLTSGAARLMRHTL